MLNQLQSDLRRLLELTRKMENFDATLAVARDMGKPIIPDQAALDKHKRMGIEAVELRAKWDI